MAKRRFTVVSMLVAGVLALGAAPTAAGATPTPSVSPTISATTAPTATASATPTVSPTVEASATPSAARSAAPSAAPSPSPSSTSAAVTEPAATVTVSGVVTHADDGAPEADATVVIYRDDYGPEVCHRRDACAREVGRTTTDANGVYSVDVPATKRYYHVLADTVVSSRYMLKTVMVRPGTSTDVEVDPVLDVGGTIAGSFVWRPDGAPIAGATVTVKVAEDFQDTVPYVYNWRTRTATTAADGTFAITGVDALEQSISVSDGTVSAHKDYTRALPGTTTTLAPFTVPRAASVSGTARFESGEPRAGLTVRLHGAGNGTLRTVRAQTVTAADGTYRFDGVSADDGFAVSFVVAPNEFVWWQDSAVPTTFGLADGQQLAGIDLNVESVGGRVSGVVTDGLTGAPVAGATVSPGYGIGTATTTDDEGRYTLVSVPTGERTITVSPSPGDSTYVDSQVPVTVVEGDENLDVVLNRYAVVTGTALGDPGGGQSLTPLSGEYVRVLSGDGRTVASAAIRSDGSFTIPRVPASDVPYTVRAGWDGGPTAETTRLIGWNQAVDVGQLVYFLPVASSGVVTGPSGALQNATSWKVEVSSARSVIRTVTLRKDGSFQVFLPLGEYTARVVPISTGVVSKFAPTPYRDGSTGLAASPIVIDQSNRSHDDLDIVLDVAPVVSGRVVDPVGEPIAGIRVTGAQGMTTLADGRFSVPAAVGSAQVSFMGAGYATEVRSFTFASGDVESGLEVTLDDSRALLSGVVTASGAPVAGVRIELYPVGVDADPVRTVVTRADGSWRIGGSRAGDYRIKAVPTDAAFAPTWLGDAGLRADARVLTIGTAPTPGLDIALVPSTAVSGRVVTTEGSPRAGAVVVAYTADLGTRLRTVRTTAAGGYSFSQLPAEAAVLKVEGTAQWAPSWTELTGPATGLDLVVSAGSTISGRAIAPTGNISLRGLRVEAYRADGKRLATSRLDDSGNYSFSGLPAGEWQIRVGYAGSPYGIEWVGESTVRSGAERIAVAVGERSTGHDLVLDRR